MIDSNDRCAYILIRFLGPGLARGLGSPSAAIVANDLLVPALGPKLPRRLTGGAVAATFADASGSPEDSDLFLTLEALSGLISGGGGCMTSGAGGVSSEVERGVADAAVGVSFSGFGVADGDEKAERRLGDNRKMTNLVGFALLPLEPVLDDWDLVMVVVGDMMEMVVFGSKMREAWRSSRLGRSRGKRLATVQNWLGGVSLCHGRNCVL